MPRYDLVQLRSFVAVVHGGSFTLAARSLGLGQSTVSQHVARLEEALGRRLFLRDTHRVRLTPEGEALVGPARALLAEDGRIRALFEGDAPVGRLRFGVSEDFTANHLAAIIGAFAEHHPRVSLSLTVALSDDLGERLGRGELDLVLAKRRLGGRPLRRGEQRLYRDPLVWLTAGRVPEPGEAVPLVTFPAPSITRAAALAALENAGRDSRIVCSCGSLSGLVAAARAGLGVLVQPESLAPPELRRVPAGALPPLEEVDVVLLTAPGADPRAAGAMERVVAARLGIGAAREERGQRHPAA